MYECVRWPRLGEQRGIWMKETERGVLVITFAAQCTSPARAIYYFYASCI